MAANALETRNAIVGRYAAQAKADSTVIFTGLAVVIAAISLLFAGVAMYIAFNADEDAKISSIYIQKLHAQLIAEGFKPPPLEEE